MRPSLNRQVHLLLGFDNSQAEHDSADGNVATDSDTRGNCDRFAAGRDARANCDLGAATSCNTNA